MARHLVIVESPAKAKTINKYLGRDYLVKSSYGHIRDLPSSGEETEEAEKPVAGEAKAAKATRVKATPEEKAAKAHTALIRRMGVDPEHGWEARYEISPDKQKVVKELREAAAKADAVWLASDLDREGEAIAWHLKEVIGGPDERFHRVVFNEITKTAIQEAFAKPGQVNTDRVNAQQARRFLDRVVGYQVSPLLWQKVARGLSAGRVQSVAVRLIVEREREIRAFIPEEYWEIHADLNAAQGAQRAAPAALRAQVTRQAGKPFSPVNQAQADAALAILNPASYVVAEREDKPQRAWPYPPFITATLQAAASVRLGFSVKKTMTLAQRLYEAGHITYMRTDSTNLSKDAIGAVRSYISGRWGERWLPESPRFYAAEAGAQEAHEAIRPTDVRVEADSLDAERDAVRLYDLIWRQFVACQMPPAEFDTSVITVKAADFDLTARGRVLRFAGWQTVLPPAKQEDVELPQVAVGEVLKLEKLDPTQHFTKPPARFSEASLVKELKKSGIGRPSTYASIISTIQERGYVRLENRRFYAEKIGDIVTSRLIDAFPDLMDYHFTADLEEDLDEIATAKEDYKTVLDRFYKDFKGKLAEAGDHMRANPPVELPGIPCQTCGRPMAVRTARTGVFLSCTGYALPPKERCKATRNLVRGDEAEAVREVKDESDDESSSEADARHLRSHHRCPICATAMDAWLVDETRKLHVCGNNPECPGTVVETGKFKLKGYEGPVIPCDRCGKTMQLKQGRFGKYFGCTGYPECKNTRKLLRNGQPAPPKMDAVPMPELPCAKGGHFVLRDGMLGLFLAANLYPKVRETRAPQVADLARHKDQIDPKYHYLAEAPATDPSGNPVVVRFARQSREHYLAGEKDGEASGWAAFWQGGKWVEKQPEAEKPRGRRAKAAK